MTIITTEIMVTIITASCLLIALSSGVAFYKESGFLVGTAHLNRGCAREGAFVFRGGPFLTVNEYHFFCQLVSISNHVKGFQKLSDGLIDPFSPFTQENPMAIDMKQVIFFFLGPQKFVNHPGALHIDHRVNA